MRLPSPLSIASITSCDLPQENGPSDHISSSSSSSSSPTKNAASSMTEVAPSTMVNQDDSILLSHLAHQLEYYFSEENLMRDTYLQTLRKLNDGCVPLSILADFAKVQRLTMGPDKAGRQQLVLRAVQTQSKLLHVVRIDTKTGKAVHHEEPEDSPHSTILAVGPCDNKPLRNITSSLSMTSLSITPVAFPSSNAQRDVVNTLILRDVDPQVTCDQVRMLLEEDPDCPKIVSIRPDVACCWYVKIASPRSKLQN
jgi:hypothetical protein